jgi:hypothetical protein
MSSLEDPVDGAMPQTGPAIPNFREDERQIGRYESMLDRRIRSFFVEHESSIRRNASEKRDELRDQLREAGDEWERRKAVAESTRESYRAQFPQHVRRTRIVPPSLVENVRSLGAANKLYGAAQEAWLAAEEASSKIRKLEHNEEQLDVELKKALERSPTVAKEITESEKWLAEIHAEEDLASAKARVDEIAAERRAYRARLDAGEVTEEEQRLRAFGERDIKDFAMPLDGILFFGAEQFGSRAYYLVRDLRKQLYALPYDRRLEPLFGGVYDIVSTGKEFQARKHLRHDTRLPFSALEHFQKCCEGDEAAQEAYREYQERVKQPRSFAAGAEHNETEAAAIALLADFVAKSGLTAAAVR